MASAVIIFLNGEIPQNFGKLQIQRKTMKEMDETFGC